MNKIAVKRALLAPALLLSVSVVGQKKADRPLNIIHIMTDDHAFQAISAYGGILAKLAPTPNIDKLAAEGMLFKQAFVENSLSTPSRACLITGLYSHQNGQRQLGKGIDSTKTFFSELLQQHGYQTGVIGKWHMQCTPKGFDYYEVLNDQGEYYNPEFKNKNSHEKYIREEGYVSTLITDHAIDFLEHRDKNKPFCLLVHHKAPHRNWMPDIKYLNLYKDIQFPYPPTFDDDYSTRCSAAHTQEMSITKNMTLVYDLKLYELAEDEKNRLKDKKSSTEYFDMHTTSNADMARALAHDKSLERMTHEQRTAWLKAYKSRNEDFISKKLQGEALARWKYQEYIKDYLRCIKSIDDEVGRLITYLKKNNLWDNTVVVYTSDQGFYLGEHGWFDKRFMYEESMRTPLIVHYPGITKAGSTSTTLVQNIDYAPTYLDIAGIQKPSYMVGTSIIPILGGKEPANWRKYLYYHYYDYPAVHRVRRHDGVRDKQYKLIHFYGEANGKDPAINCNEFYNLKTDPHELNNLYGKTEYKSVISRLQQRLDKFRKDLKIDEY